MSAWGICAGEPGIDGLRTSRSTETETEKSAEMEMWGLGEWNEDTQDTQEMQEMPAQAMAAAEAAAAAREAADLDKPRGGAREPVRLAAG